MPEQQIIPQGSVTYYFLRSKDVHEEEGTEFITLFARLTREFTFCSEEHVYSRRQSVWVDIDEVESQNAPQKVKELPNAIQTFKIQENVFKELVEASKTCPKELYFVTPISLKQKLN